MGELKQINIQNQSYYFYNDIVDLENFDARLLKIYKKSFKDIDIYYNGYVKKNKIDDCNNINSVNPLYLRIDCATGYIEEKNGDKYLAFDSADENKKLLKKYNDVWNKIKNKIEEVSDSECNSKKDYVKIKFNSDDNLPLNKPLKFHNMTITITSVFIEGDNFIHNFFT